MGMIRNFIGGLRQGPFERQLRDLFGDVALRRNGLRGYTMELREAQIVATSPMDAHADAYVQIYQWSGFYFMAAKNREDCARDLLGHFARESCRTEPMQCPTPKDRFIRVIKAGETQSRFYQSEAIATPDNAGPDGIPVTETVYGRKLAVTGQRYYTIKPVDAATMQRLHALGL